MFHVFSFLYSVAVHGTPYLFHLYTTSLPTYILLVFCSSKIFSRKNVYVKTTFVGSVSYIYYLSLNNNSIIIIHRYLGFKFIIYMTFIENIYVIENNE
jgi:hypothetical protein